MRELLNGTYKVEYRSVRVWQAKKVVQQAMNKQSTLMLAHSDAIAQAVKSSPIPGLPNHRCALIPKNQIRIAVITSIAKQFPLSAQVAWKLIMPGDGSWDCLTVNFEASFGGKVIGIMDSESMKNSGARPFSHRLSAIEKWCVGIRALEEVSNNMYQEV